MRFQGKAFWLLSAFSALFLIACVTINIYFPAEKVDAVAEEIVNEIRGAQNPNGEGKPPGSDKGSYLRKKLLPLMCSSAWADEITTVSNPTIRALKNRMKTRYEQMKPFFQKGALKEGDDGYVSVTNTAGMDLKAKRDLRNLVDSENKDRRALYAEVARSLSIDPSQVGKIGQRFAKKWQESVP